MKIKQIKAGDQFVCIKDVFMKAAGEHEYIKGQIYKAEFDSCITDEGGDKSHGWPVCENIADENDPSLYFEKLVPSVVEELKSTAVEAIFKKMQEPIPAKPQVDKTTQGPWYAVNYAGYINIQPSPNYSHINLLDMDKCESAEANGKLAAAAPDLLRIVKEFVKAAEYISSSKVALYELRNEAESLVNKLKPHRCTMFNKSSKGTFCTDCGKLKWPANDL